MNRCAICGKFRSWLSLKTFYSTEIASEYGGLNEEVWFECDRCRKVPAEERE